MRCYFFRQDNTNLVPRVFVATIVANERPYPAIERLLQVGWLGLVMNVAWPLNKWKRAWSWPR